MRTNTREFLSSTSCSIFWNIFITSLPLCRRETGHCVKLICPHQLEWVQMLIKTHSIRLIHTNISYCYRSGIDDDDDFIHNTSMYISASFSVFLILTWPSKIVEIQIVIAMSYVDNETARNCPANIRAYLPLRTTLRTDCDC